MVEDRKTATEVELITPVELTDQELELVNGGGLIVITPAVQRILLEGPDKTIVFGVGPVEGIFFQ